MMNAVDFCFGWHYIPIRGKYEIYLSKFFNNTIYSENMWYITMGYIIITYDIILMQFSVY